MYKLPNDKDWSFLVGGMLTQLCIGLYDIKLVFDSNVVISIQVEVPEHSFHHKCAHSGFQKVPGVPGNAATLVSLLGEKVERVFADNNITLVVVFSNAETLSICDSSDNYESFTIDSPNGTIVV